MQTRLAGLVVLGSNGEAPLLDDAESDAVIETVRAHVPRDRTLIGGVGRESTAATIAAAKRAARIGVDIVLVRTPSFYKNVMTSDAFVRHYTAVADASPVPVLLYNVSMFTGRQPAARRRRAARRAPEHHRHERVERRSRAARRDDRANAGRLRRAGRIGADVLSRALRGRGWRRAGHLGRRPGYLRRDGRPGARRSATRRRSRCSGASRRSDGCWARCTGVAGLKYALDQIGYVGGPTRPPLGTVSARGAEADPGTARGTGDARGEVSPTFRNRRPEGQKTKGRPQRCLRWTRSFRGDDRSTNIAACSR